MKLKVCILVVAVIVILCAQAAVAIHMYVDPVNGDDSNDGFSWETAVKTITRASQASHIHLAEGTFSEATGEVFPIVFTHGLCLLSGQGYEKTIIDAGGSTRIMDCGQVGECTMTGLTIRRKGTVPCSDISGAAITLPSVKAHFEHVWFADFYNIPIFRGLHDATFTGCRFSGGRDCLFYHEDSDDDVASLVMTDCVFEYSWEPEEKNCSFQPDFAPDVGFHLEMKSCRFSSLGGTPEILFAPGLWFYITNCSFEGCDLLLSTGANWNPHGCIRGCSFRSSTVTTRLTEYCHVYVCAGSCDILLCAFDPESSLVIEQGNVSMWSSWFPVIAIIEDSYVENYFSMQNVHMEDPRFVHGPLGSCYLSNIDSGQEVSSPCLDVAPAAWWEAYSHLGPPPEGSTTRTDGVPDEAPFDIGYHYPSVPPPPPKVGIATDRAEYAAGDEMTVSMSYENRGVKVEGAVYFAFGPESLDWLVFWPWMTFVPTPYFEGTLWSGVSYPNLPSTMHTIPENLAPGSYLWLGAVLNADGSFASDIALCPVTIQAAGR